MTTEITKKETVQGFVLIEYNNTIACIRAVGKYLLFTSFNDAIRALKEDVEAVKKFDSEEDLDRFLEDTEICSVCGEICWPDDECYSDEETGDACCTKCCFYDERDDVYRKGTELEFRLKEFAEGSECCPHCGSEDYEQDEKDEEPDCIIEHFECKNCNQRWFKRYSFDKVGAGDSMHIITSEDEDMLAAENKAMGNFLEKQVGFSQEDVSNIANGDTQFYCVHVVCENTLEHYSIYTSEEKAIEKYLDLCKEWYNEESVEKFRQNNQYENDAELFDAYYGSDEYHNSSDYANVSWEKLS